MAADSMWQCVQVRATVREIVVGCHSVAAGLAACHSRGVVHQDIRPANILLTTDGVHCKVADFGSKLNRPDLHVSPTTLLCMGVMTLPDAAMPKSDLLHLLNMASSLNWQCQDGLQYHIVHPSV